MHLCALLLYYFNPKYLYSRLISAFFDNINLSKENSDLFLEKRSPVKGYARLACWKDILYEKYTLLPRLLESRVSD